MEKLSMTLAVIGFAAGMVPAQSGQFQPATSRTWPAVDGFAVAVGDLEPDGDVDVITVAIDHASICVNDGTGRFRDTTLTASTGGFWGHPALGDVDGDGDLDLLIPRVLGAPLLFRNDLGAGFVGVPFSPLATFAADSAALVDVDGDGDTDAILVGQPLELHLNDGAGNFLRATNQLPNTNASGIVVIDLEPDGDPDLVSMTAPGVGNLLVNDGHGVFIDAPGTQWVATSTRGMCAADFDGDGRVDLYFGASASRGVLLLQRTPNQFVDVSATHLPTLANWAFEAGVDVADLDGDGDLDIYAGCNNIVIAVPDRLMLNRGDGSFTLADPARIGGPVNLTNAVRLADVDRDGDPDLVLGSRAPGPASLLQLNHHRHASMDTAPVRGAPLNLRFDSQPGYAPAFALAVGVLGVRGVPLEIRPFGTWFLRNAPSIQLPPLFIPPTLGTTTMSLIVPDDPALFLVDIGLQAAIIDPAAPARLTNAAFDVVR